MITEAAFRASLAEQGFEPPTEAVRDPNFATTEHSHEYTATALILAGRITVVAATGTFTCGPGDTFTLASGIPHHEEYGPEGARFLFSKRVP